MKAPISWLKDFVDIEISPKNLLISWFHAALK